MMEEKGYHKLLIWQRARELVKLVYFVSGKFPESEKHNLTSQIRRAAISIVLNIVEGHKRSIFQKEFKRFLNISDGSLVEVEACLELALDLGFLSKPDFEKVEAVRRELGAMLNSFIKNLK